MRNLSVALVVMSVCARPSVSFAQATPERFQAGVQVASAISSEFDHADIGVGGWLSWSPIDLVGLEGEVTFYPGDYPGDQAFSAGRTEGLFGATIGPRFTRLRPFARLRAGFLAIQEAPRPFACILIYPPPLSCLLATGHTLTVFDLGGGVEMFATPKTFLRVDVGDRIVKYPGPAFLDRRMMMESGFFGHDLRIAAGGGLRF